MYTNKADRLYHWISFQQNLLGYSLIFSLNSMIFLDLFLTILNPFKVRKSRVKFYYGYTVAIFFIKMIFQDITEDSLSFINKLFDIEKQISIFVPLVSVILVVAQLLRPGTSKDLKYKVVYRHITYLIIYYLSVFSAYNQYRRLNSFSSSIIILFDLSGILLSLIRLAEPYVYK